jgi:2-polyprenyl-6-hydroxyphenyl methylase/3-demethylubiquinone-9 3-methyltransferase
VSDRQAAEHLDLEEADARLAESRDWMVSVLARLAPMLRQDRPLDVLEVGCAQGRGLIALGELGHRAVGIDPEAQALAVAGDLAARHGVEIETLLGTAERIPCASDSFDLVVAFSVLEHVDDLGASLREVARVLRPGGVFWFNSASAMCPVQQEISHVPLFGWYPDPLKRRIMLWARDNRPAWIGHTKHPALHWWTPRRARRELHRAGLTDVRDRWQLRAPLTSGPKGRAVRLVSRHPTLSLVADVAVPGCSYAARKP